MNGDVIEINYIFYGDELNWTLMIWNEKEIKFFVGKIRDWFNFGFKWLL